MSLPRGRVTLLFTDIEASTSLVQSLGPEYPIALGRHRELLRDAVEAHEGTVVDMLGDETSNVFTDPTRAVTAALEAQRALRENDFRVRMGIHTGEPSQSGGSYYGVDVHRAARQDRGRRATRHAHPARLGHRR